MTIEITEQDFYNMRNQRDQARTMAITREMERLTADAKLNDMAWNDNQAALKKQAEEIRIIKTAIEDIKIYCNNPSAWDYYDETVSQKIRAILKAAGMA